MMEGMNGLPPTLLLGQWGLSGRKGDTAGGATGQETGSRNGCLGDREQRGGEWAILPVLCGVHIRSAFLEL